MNLPEIYAELLRRGVRCYSGDYNFDCGADALTIKTAGGAWGVFLDEKRIRTTAEETVAVGHEYAHVVEDATYTLDAPAALRALAETRANRFAYNHLAPFNDVVRLLRAGRSFSEIAAALNVTEAFLREAWEYYTGPGGMSA